MRLFPRSVRPPWLRKPDKCYSSSGALSRGRCRRKPPRLCHLRCDRCKRAAGGEPGRGEQRRARLQDVVTESDLQLRGFHQCVVTARTLNIDHPGPVGLGPFCRLKVEDLAPARPGVYAWTKDRAVMYVGRANQLRQVVHGVRMQRGYNDYTYIPASNVGQSSSPRVRVNGLLNRALCEGAEVRWWWTETFSEGGAIQLEGQLIHEWSPPWNRARPTLIP